MTPFLLALIFIARPDSTTLVGDAIRYLSGASDFEAVAQEDAEKYESLSRNPLKINSCSRSQLLSSNLFSTYQVEAVIDYRKRCGPICSQEELSVVDGFDERLAGYLSCFLDFDPSLVRQPSFDGEISAFSAVKVTSGKLGAQWMGRAKASYGDFSASFASKSSWTWPISLPDNFGCSFSYSSDKTCLSQVVAGYYNARFGQGLCLWSGVVMENYATPSALMKRPGGIAPYCSSSIEYAMRGAAVCFDFARFSVASFYDCSSHKAGGNISWNHAHGHVGVTAWGNLTGEWCSSVDFQQMIGRFTLYGESTILQTLLGVRAVLGNVDLGLRAFYSRQQQSVAFAASWQSPSRRHLLDFGSTVGGRQVKTLTQYTFSINETWSAVARLSAKTKNWTQPYRIDLRTDLRWHSESWSVSSRINALYSQGISGLGYLEGAYMKTVSALKNVNKFEVWLQSGVFLVDNWENRIYVYQKDAPQSFNVPAMYGRGYWISVFSSLRLFKRMNIYLRGTWEDYPWAREGDTRTRPSLSVKFQLVVNLGS